MLSEACEDHQSLIDPERQLRFELSGKSLEPLAGKDRNGKLVEADWALLEQCVNNLVDNAAKYSFPNTVVNVSGGVQSNGSEFFISVASEGIEVKPDEVKRLKERGYRTDRAISVTGEGSGIGLWIVDAIMTAHGGRLAINALPSGLIDFRLVFPIVKGVINLSDETEDIVIRG
jgi:signal transduction histidine kinase